MPPGQTKPWWNRPKFFALFLPVAGLDQEQPTRCCQSDITDMDKGGDLIKSFDFVVQCKTLLNKFLNEHISVANHYIKQTAIS